MSVRVIRGVAPNTLFCVEKLKPEINATGFDLLTGTYGILATSTPVTGTTLAALFPPGSLPPEGGHGNFYLTGSKVVRVDSPYVEIAVDYKGISSIGRAPTWRIGAGVEQQGAENVTVGGTTYAKIAVLEASPWIECSYVALSAPDTALIGTNQWPGRSIGVRSSGWTALADFTAHFPPGPGGAGGGNWVLLDRSIEELPGATVCFVTDKYQWQFFITP